MLPVEVHVLERDHHVQPWVVPDLTRHLDILRGIPAALCTEADIPRDIGDHPWLTEPYQCLAPVVHVREFYLRILFLSVLHALIMFYPPLVLLCSRSRIVQPPEPRDPVVSFFPRRESEVVPFLVIVHQVAQPLVSPFLVPVEMAVEFDLVIELHQLLRWKGAGRCTEQYKDGDDVYHAGSHVTSFRGPGIYRWLGHCSSIEKLAIFSTDSRVRRSITVTMSLNEPSQRFSVDISSR